MRVVYFLLCLTLMSIPFANVHAIEIPGFTNSLSITISPTYPRPFEEILITPESSGIDLSRFEVTILVDGEEVYKGEGPKSRYALLKEAGKPTTIVVRAENASGEKYEESLTIIPASIALLVESGVPAYPFYPGANLIPSESMVRIIALPEFKNQNGSLINPNTLIYTWKEGERLLAAHSGRGKQAITIEGPVRYRSSTISVIASTPDEKVVARGVVRLVPGEPLVNIYESDPLLGVLFNRALEREVNIEDDERTFRAIPFNMGGNAQVAWSVNREQGAQSKDITVRPDGRGRAVLEAFVEEEGTILQRASTALTVLFELPQSGIFNL